MSDSIKLIIKLIFKLIAVLGISILAYLSTGTAQESFMILTVLIIFFF